MRGSDRALRHLREAHARLSFDQRGQAHGTASPALLLTSNRVVVKRTDQAIAGQVSWGPYGLASNLAALAGVS